MSASIAAGGPARNTESVWGRCSDLIASLDMPVPFDVFELCRRVAAIRGLLMVIRPENTGLAENVSGFWVSYADHDLVVYDRGTTPYHRDGIILHELGHILFGHYPAGDFAEHVARAFPDVAGAARQMFGVGRCRFDYSVPEEREAEVFATLVLERYRGGAEESTDPVTAGVAEQSSSNLLVAPLALAKTYSEHSFNFGENFAGSVLLSLIPALLLFVLQRFFALSVAASGNK